MKKPQELDPSSREDPVYPDKSVEIESRANDTAQDVTTLRQITNVEWWGEGEAKRIEQRMQQSSAHSVRDKVLRCVARGKSRRLENKAPSE